MSRPFIGIVKVYPSVWDGVWPCCACIKNCPTGAKVWEDSMMKNIANWLNENCSSRKEPQIFGIDVK